MFRKLYDWTPSSAASPRAEPVLGAISFVESSVFSIPADVLFVPMCLSRPERAMRYALIATVTSVLGGIFGWAIGLWFFDLIAQPVLEFYGRARRLQRAEKRNRRDGDPGHAGHIRTVAPATHGVVLILSGVVAFDLKLFIISAIIARGGFYLLAWLLQHLGRPLPGFIEQPLAVRSGLPLAAALQARADHGSDLLQHPDPRGSGRLGALLLGALAFQYMGVAPCALCIWQRWPHLVAVLLGALGLVAGDGRTSFRGWPCSADLYGHPACSMWASSRNGGKASPAALPGRSAASARRTFLEPCRRCGADVRCDEIPWQMLGVSMAGWNVLASVALAMIWFALAPALSLRQPSRIDPDWPGMFLDREAVGHAGNMVCRSAQARSRTVRPQRRHAIPGASISGWRRNSRNRSSSIAVTLARAPLGRPRSARCTMEQEAHRLEVLIERLGEADDRCAHRADLVHRWAKNSDRFCATWMTSSTMVPKTRQKCLMPAARMRSRPG